MKRLLKRANSVTMVKSYSHTFPVKTTKDVGCCSFVSLPEENGNHWNVHKGKLMGKLGKVKTVVKVSTLSVRGHTDKADAEVGAEEQKIKFAERALTELRSRGGNARAIRVRVEPVYRTSIYKIGRMGQAARRQRNGSLSEDENVLVQERVPEDIRCLLDVKGTGRERGLSPPPTALLALVDESYKRTDGNSVITRIKGTEVLQGGKTSYCITSLTVQSKSRKYGDTDEGEQGVRAYEEWRKLWPSPPTTASHLQPSAPFPSITSRDPSSHDQPDGGRWPSPQDSDLSWFLVRPMENTVPHHDRDQGRNAVNDVFAQLYAAACQPQLLVEADLNRLLGPPPKYSFTDQNSLSGSA